MATCKDCNATIDWGRLCDDCCDAEKRRRLHALPDSNRCRYCGGIKGKGHSTASCRREAERITRYLCPVAR